MKAVELIEQLRNYPCDSEVMFFPDFENIKHKHEDGFVMFITNGVIHGLDFPMMKHTNGKEVILLIPKIKKRKRW